MTTEELLEQLEAEAQSETPVCVIDPETRTITVPPEYQLLGVENDKRVERITFRCPKIVGDNQDLSQNYQLFVNYQNANGDPDAYHIDDMEVDGDNIAFSWLLEENVTKYKGSIQIAFAAIIPGDTPEDPDKNRWNTTINTDCTVLTGLKCTQQVAESNPDALVQIWAAIDELKAGGGGTVDPEQIKQAVNGYLEENPPSGMTAEQEQQLNQNTTDVADLKSALSNKLDTNQGAENKGKSMVVGEDGGLVPGNIAKENTTFFEKKQIGELTETYSQIAQGGVLADENYSQTNGYYVSMVSQQYNAFRMTKDASKVSFFRKVKSGDIVKIRDRSGHSINEVTFIDENIYNLIMSGYQSEIGSSIDWEYVVKKEVTKNSLGQIRQDLTPELYKVWPDKVGYFVSEYIYGEAPFDGYLLLPNVYSTVSFVENFPTYEYKSQVNYGYTLENTLKNDPVIGEQMKKLLGLSYNKATIKISKFNFSPITDAIGANTESTAILEKLTEPLGNLQYVGGICANKKIYMAPNTASQIMVYDTINNYHYFIGADLGEQAFKYTGWVAYGGYLYSIPRGVNNFLRVDPVTDEVTIIELDTKYPIAPYGDYRDSHHYNGVISDDGFMYLPPAYSSDKLLKINMEDFTHEELDFTSDDVSTWIGCVKHPTENKIIFLSTKVFRIWNCENDTYTDIVDGTTRSCYDMVYDPRYNSFVGVYPNHVFALSLADNSIDNSIIDSDYINYMSTGYGVSLGLDGAIYHLEGKTAYKFTFNGTIFTQEDSITTSENVGSTTPYLAGQAIDNKGDIYGIPASGSLVRLKFSGLTREVPDYIVASQYYGKY